MLIWLNRSAHLIAIIMTDTIRTSVTLSAADHAELTRVAQSVGISQADLIRAAVGKMLSDIHRDGRLELPVTVAEDRSRYGADD
jgi:hypothetical protein